MSNREGRRKIKDLIAKYSARRQEYRKTNTRYSEADLRADFIDEFFEALGWDIKNREGRSQRYREVIRETRVNIDERTKKPDYEFRLGTQRKLFVEAKKPKIDLINNNSAAFQVRRYGWSAGLPISVLTNFEHLILYDTTIEPKITHNASHSRLLVYSYKDYISKYEEIKALLSKESVYSGQFDNRSKNLVKLRQRHPIDAVFVNKLDEWRIILAEEILRAKPQVDNQRLNELVQRLLHRILFLRMCEDRGVQTYEHLKNIIKTQRWKGFVELLKKSDKRFDSTLFDISDDPFCNPSRNKIILKHNALEKIIDSLYYPEAPYTFSVFDSEFLGQVYEFFLLKQLSLKNGEIVLKEKPENVDRDIVFTPRPIIDYLVETTLGPFLKDLPPEKITKAKILDPACGSGGFLLSTYDLLINYYIEFCRKSGETSHIYEDQNSWKLTFDKKKEILINCLFGVDRDLSATEVTRFSLLVKLLEDENQASLPQEDRILPPLIKNIVNGDSLVDDSIYTEASNPKTIGPPLAWGTDIRCPFDFIIGNPPYLKTEDMINHEKTEHRFYLKHYHTAYRQFDKYYLFIERALKKLLSLNGHLGFVVSNKFAHIESGKHVREMLSKGRHLYRLIDFGNAQLFDRKTTYTCLLYLSKKPIEDADGSVEYELINSPKDWLEKSARFLPPKIKIPRRFVSGESWLLPNSADELKLINQLFKESIPLGKEFDVFNGVQTSRNDVYVLEHWKKKGKDVIEFKENSKTWEIEEAITKPFFHNGNLRSFFPLPETAKIIFPYKVTKDRRGLLTAKVIPPGEMRKNFPKTYAWLLYNKSKLICPPRDIQPRPFPRDEWYRYGRDQALIVFERRPKIVVGINSLGDKYVYDESNTLLASGGTAGECAISYYLRENNRSRYNLSFILALLNHKSIEYFCRKRGSPFRGGWFARGTAVLKEIPIPIIDFQQRKGNTRLKIYNEIVVLSKAICRLSEKLSRDTSDSIKIRLQRQKVGLKKQMDDKISKLFGINNFIHKVKLPNEF